MWLTIIWVAAIIFVSFFIGTLRMNGVTGYSLIGSSLIIIGLFFGMALYITIIETKRNGNKGDNND